MSVVSDEFEDILQSEVVDPFGPSSRRASNASSTSSQDDPGVSSLFTRPVQVSNFENSPAPTILDIWESQTERVRMAALIAGARLEVPETFRDFEPQTIHLAQRFLQMGFSYHTAINRASEIQNDVRLNRARKAWYDALNDGFAKALEIEACLEEIIDEYPEVVEFVMPGFTENVWDEDWIDEIMKDDRSRDAPIKLKKLLNDMNAIITLVESLEDYQCDNLTDRQLVDIEMEDDANLRTWQRLKSSIRRPIRDVAHVSPLPPRWHEKLWLLSEKSRTVNSGYSNILEDLKHVFAAIDNDAARAYADALSDPVTAPDQVHSTIDRFWNGNISTAVDWHCLMLACIPYIGRLANQFKKAVDRLENDSRDNRVPPADTVLPELEVALRQFHTWQTSRLGVIARFVAEHHEKMLKENPDNLNRGVARFRTQFGMLSKRLTEKRFVSAMDLCMLMGNFQRKRWMSESRFDDFVFVRHLHFFLNLRVICTGFQKHVQVMKDEISLAKLYLHRMRNSRSALAWMCHCRYSYHESVLTAGNFARDHVPFSRAAEAILEGLAKNTELSTLYRIAKYGNLQYESGTFVKEILGTAIRWRKKLDESMVNLNNVLESHADANLEYVSSTLPGMLDEFRAKLNGDDADGVQAKTLQLGNWVLPEVRRLETEAPRPRDSIFLHQALLLSSLLNLPERKNPSGFEIWGLVDRWLVLRNWSEGAVKAHIRRYRKAMTERAVDREGHNTDIDLVRIIAEGLEHDVAVERLAPLGLDDDAESRRAGADFAKLLHLDPPMTVQQYIGTHRDTLINIARKLKRGDMRELLNKAAQSNFHDAMWALEDAHLLAMNEKSEECQSWQTILGYRAALYRAESILSLYEIKGTARDKERLLRSFDDIAD